MHDPQTTDQSSTAERERVTGSGSRGRPIDASVRTRNDGHQSHSSTSSWQSLNRKLTFTRPGHLPPPMSHVLLLASTKPIPITCGNRSVSLYFQIHQTKQLKFNTQNSKEKKKGNIKERKKWWVLCLIQYLEWS